LTILIIAKLVAFSECFGREVRSRLGQGKRLAVEAGDCCGPYGSGYAAQKTESQQSKIGYLGQGWVR
jgi:hypothetical protein